MKLNPDEIARAKRDRFFRRVLCWSLIPLLVLYFIADGCGFVPAVVSVRIRNDRRNYIDPAQFGKGADPDRVLGIPIGDTRFRLNHGNGHAIVTRPIKGVQTWLIPAHFDYLGTHFTVVALDPFAFLYATEAETISLPHTLMYDNGAPQLANPCLKQLLLRKSDGSTQEIPLPCQSITNPEA